MTTQHNSSEFPRYEKIMVSDLKLDNMNPRLPKSLRGQSEDKIIEYLLFDASLIELMLAIGENDFFPGEQLLVVQDGDNMYRVVEGNRRLAAVRLLSHPELAKVQKGKVQQAVEEAKYKPQEIPCLIFAREEDIYNYLGYRHITGIKEWKLLEKARYLYELWMKNFQDLNIEKASREIAKIIGSRKDYVRRILAGFEIYKTIEDEGFYRIRDLDDTTFYFNYIADSLNRANIANFLGVDFLLETPVSNLNQENLKNGLIGYLRKTIKVEPD